MMYNKLKKVVLKLKGKIQEENSNEYSDGEKAE